MKKQYKDIIDYQHSRRELQVYWFNIHEKANSSQQNMMKHRKILNQINNAKGCWDNLCTKEKCDSKLAELKEICKTTGLNCDDSDDSDEDSLFLRANYDGSISSDSDGES